LANALNSEEYDFILIDDPIQSMDSINILATIDLLRGIVANLNKQIILTTHDFNFYNLLKMKIPRDKFKAKYFTFETFGKVAEDLN
jgi:exonuclease SbcC